jgi:Domain of unknown function (DUF6457)
MNAWFADFSARCAQTAARHRAPIAAPDLNAAVARELLELTREVAHSSERQFAPLAAFVAGQAIDRMTRSNPTLETSDIVTFLQELREGLTTDQT